MCCFKIVICIPAFFHGFLLFEIVYALGMCWANTGGTRGVRHPDLGSRLSASGLSSLIICQTIKIHSLAEHHKHD